MKRQFCVEELEHGSDGVAVMSDLGGHVAERGRLTEGLIGVGPAMWSGGSCVGRLRLALWSLWDR